MNKVNLISVLILSAALAGCGEGKKQHAIDLVTVDMNASYPEKELILQDFMDVEYIPLETTDEFITHGIVTAVGKTILLVRNQTNDGDIFVFDRATGKGLRKINRLGQSGEEYAHIPSTVLDEDNNEFFVIDYPVQKILVYDLYGNFKRSFKFSDTSYYADIYNYDQDNLICYKQYMPTAENEQSVHQLISKKDGSVTREIKIPFKEIATPVATKDGAVVMPAFYQTVPYPGCWAITRPSSDTLYNLLPDGDLIPFIVRTPSIHSMDPQIFLFPTAVTDRYYFMQALTKKFNFEKMRGFSTNGLAYDKQEKALFQYTLYNGDFTNKKPVTMSLGTENKEIAAFQVLNAPNLVEAYEKEQLTGKLKEIAAGLNEESNPVVMLIKHKK